METGEIGAERPRLRRLKRVENEFHAGGLACQPFAAAAAQSAFAIVEDVETFHRIFWVQFPKLASASPVAVALRATEPFRSQLAGCMGVSSFLRRTECDGYLLFHRWGTGGRV